VTRRVFLLVLVLGLICSGTVLAHPFVIRSDAQRATDSQIDEFLDGHPADDWDVYGVQYYDWYNNRGWVFELFAVPEGSQFPFGIVPNEEDNTTLIKISKLTFGRRYDWLSWEGVEYSNVENTRYMHHENEEGDYSIIPLPPMNPLQMAMEGAVTTMTTPVRQLLPAMMITMVGLVGFAKGWTLLRKLLLRA
jgi:hypothetical protein